MIEVKTVLRAHKSPGLCGRCGTRILARESYFWWRYRARGTSHREIRCEAPACYPKEQDLHPSEFCREVWRLEQALNQGSPRDLKSILVHLRESVYREREKWENVPPQLRTSANMLLMGERVDRVEEWITELENYPGPTSSRDLWQFNLPILGMP